MSDRARCDLCDRSTPTHASYIVRMDIFADPSIPPIDTETLSDANFDDSLNQLLDEMKDLSADDLQDDVHRRLEFRLCKACHRRFLANPLGHPRIARTGSN